MKRLLLTSSFILFSSISILAQSNPDQLDKDGRVAFNSLRDFQKLMETEYKSQARWPTGFQHMEIVSKLNEAYDGIKASLVYGLQKPNPQVNSMMNNALKQVQEINTFLNTVTDQPIPPAKVKTAAIKALTAYKKLIIHFPPIFVDEEHLTR